MSYIPIQDDIEILYQSKLDLFIRIHLLDKTFKTIDQLEGELIDDSYTIDSESDIRRTINLTMFVKDSSFYINKNSKIWIDKYIKVEIGITYQRTGNIMWYPMGTYIFNEIGYNYDLTTKNLTLTCVDLMANMTGLRRGQVSGLTTQIPEGSNIRNAIIQTVTQLGGFSKYRIDSRNKKSDAINLFDISNSNNIYIDCSIQNANLISQIKIGKQYSSIKYKIFQNTLTQQKTYTFCFTTKDDISKVQCELLLYGKRTDNKEYQSVINQIGENFVNITIDKEFTEFDYLEIRLPKLSAISKKDIIFIYTNLALYEGNYNSSNIPVYVSFDNSQVVPFDLKFSTGATIYDILSQLNNLYAGWEMFFDTDDTFINQKIPTTENARYVIDWETLDKLVISETQETTFEGVKNCTKIWGKCTEADKTIDQCINKDNEYQITIDKLIPTGNDDIPYGSVIAFKTNIANTKDMKLKITDNFGSPVTNESGQTTYKKYELSYPIVTDSDVNILPDRMLANTYYVVKYRSKKFYLLGQFQVVYIVKEYNVLPLKQGQTKEKWIEEDKKKEATNNIKYIINSESDKITSDMTETQKKALYNPFAIDEIGELRQVLSGGDYDLIYSDDLARQRCEYENWKSMRLNINMSLETKPILWLDVNQKIQYKNRINNQIDEYIVKTINGSSMSGKITIDLVKFFPLYPFIVEE